MSNLGALYLLSEGSKARKDGPRIVIEKDDKIVGRIALRSIDGVVVSRNAQISTQTIFSLVEQNIVT